MDIDLWRPLAGLGLFLFSMRIIEDAIEALSGRTFRHFIRHNTNPPLRGVASGTVATAVLQSSSLVGLMMLALVGAGVLRMRNALAVVFGANLGTTMTGWIVATIGFKLDLDAAALPLVALGGIAAIAISNARLKACARFAFGLGLLLMGLEFMKGAAGDLRTLIPVETLQALSALEYLLFGLLFSAVVQSSSATMMVALSALHGGIIDLPAAAVVAIGADLGTTGTVLIGAFRGSAAKKRVAAGHFVFNLVTDVIAFVLRGPLLALVLLLELSDVLSLVAFHSLFNVLGIVLFLPFINRFAGLLEQHFDSADTPVSSHLSADAVALPDAAAEAINAETGCLIERVIATNQQVFDPPLAIGSRRSPDVSRGFAAEYADCKRLEGEVLHFAGEAAAFGFDTRQNEAVERCQEAVREAIHAAKSLQDTRADLDLLGRSRAAHAYPDRFRAAQERLYTHLIELLGDSDTPLAERKLNDKELNGLRALNHSAHEALHDAIYADIRSAAISRSSVSPLLNLNREVFNSNTALIDALETYGLIELDPEGTGTAPAPTESP